LEEPEFFQLYVEGERVVDADVRISYNHRGIEQRCETLTYDQIPFILARVCGICSASHPMAFCKAVEDICDVDVPPRAKLIRSIICELERIHSHMLWVGLAGHFIGYNTVFMWAWRYREPILDLCERVTGSRNHYENFKVGGCRRDIPQDSIPDILREVREVAKPVRMLTDAVLDDPVLNVRLRGVAVLTEEAGREYAVTGPTARGSNIPIDARRDEPYAAYDMVDWDVVVQPEGDVFAKTVVRLLETLEACTIIERCLEKMEPGEIDNEPRRIPAGEGIGHGEAPRGETFHYVRSDGTNYPVRYKVRAPTYVNLPAFKPQIIGGELADAMLGVAAMDPCYSCTERMAVVDRKRNLEGILTMKDLLALSHEKTARLLKHHNVKSPAAQC